MCAKIILINKTEYEVDQDDAAFAYYSIIRDEKYCPIQDNFKLPKGNIKKIEFDHVCESGNYDCLACAGDFMAK